MAEYKSYETEFKKNLKELDEEIKGAQNDDQLREVRKKVQELERAIERYYDNAQFFLTEDDRQAMETIIEYAKK